MGNNESNVVAAELTGVLPGAGTSSSSSSSGRGVRSNAVLPPVSVAHVAPAQDATQTDATVGPTSVDTYARAASMRIEPPAHALVLTGPVKLQQQQSCPLATTRGSSASSADSRDFVVPESVRKSQMLATFVDVCSEIVPQLLYVSNLRVARDAGVLAAHGITHIIDCCKELSASEPPAAFADDIIRLQLALRDDVHEDLSWFFYQVVEFIEVARCSNSDSRVLVHCHQGISRSCALVVAYVMFGRQRQSSAPSFRKALAVVKAKRPIASPNTAFLCQLIEWERELASVASLSSSVASQSQQVLYRLAPHAAHDASTLVLKCCYEPHATQRKRVLVPIPSASDMGHASEQRAWLYTHGIFVFVQQHQSLQPATEATLASTWRVVIWRGRACTIPHGVATAKTLVQQVARVRRACRLDDRQAIASSLDDTLVIVEVDEGDDDDAWSNAADTQIDHFNYATELAWLVPDAAAHNDAMPSQALQALRSVSNGDAIASALESLSAGEARDKPQLYVLDSVDASDSGDCGAWDRLTDYDADDLTLSDVFLLLQPSLRHHFLWIGAACAVDTATLTHCAKRYIYLQSIAHSSNHNNSNDTDTSARIELVSSGSESDAFWAAFERGY